MSSSGTSPLRVILACPGLGHIARGYETFTRECFDALRVDERLDVHLFKGAGPPADREQAIWCMKRTSWAAKALGASIRRDGYYVESATFAWSLIAHIKRLDADVVYFSDGTVGNMLWRWKRRSKSRVKLLLCNGGQLGPPGFPRMDHVHQGLAARYEESRAAGRPDETQTLIPQGFVIPRDFVRPSKSERAALRSKLSLPADRPAVLTIGVVNVSIKRMDHLVREIARLPAPRPTLVILGQRDHETPGILELAERELGRDGYRCLTVAAADVLTYCDACDVFALASPKEGFGRVLVEAMGRGMPCVVPDKPYAREILGEFGYYGELEQPGSFTGLLATALAESDDDPRFAARHRAAYERFSWDQLRPSYVDMIERCVGDKR